ncbi:MAG: shikimate dehydrogenase [Bacteroides sp. SM23_62_1]|nr:MAG: shikimate dehydrogenase [Bacteroides sp. SM23_62_1]
MKLLGLIGYPLTHSFSEGYFANKFSSEKISGYEYRNFPLDDISKFPDLFHEQPGLIGLNVTIPYKEKIIPYLDKLDPTAEKIGAVNTIKIIRDKGKYHLSGYNTDAHGFHHSISPFLLKTHTHALILGTGGASKAVAYVFNQLGIDYTYVSRTPSEGQISYRDICLPVISKNLIIVNTSPLGTFPDIDTYPDIPYDLLTPDHILYDLVYNPPETAFLRFGMQKGATCINGQRMLELQAERSWEIWTG